MLPLGQLRRPPRPLHSPFPNYLVLQRSQGGLRLGLGTPPPLPPVAAPLVSWDSHLLRGRPPPENMNLPVQGGDFRLACGMFDLPYFLF